MMIDTTHLVISLVSGIVGFLLGFFFRNILGRDMESKDAKMIVLILVSTVWFASVIVEIVNPAYHTNPMVHGLMGSIVGFFYKFEPKKDETSNRPRKK